MSTRTLIIGQGLAGSLLAWKLLKTGAKVTVVDSGLPESASSVAAGLINPLAGRRFSPAAETPHWLSVANHTYQELAHELGQEFYQTMPSLRLFQSAQQREFYRQAQDRIHDLVEAEINTQELPLSFDAPHGGIRQNHTGFVRTGQLLKSIREALIEQDSFRQLDVTAESLHCQPQGCQWQGETYSRVVFCEGAKLANNPYFHRLPLQAAKGEIVDLEVNNARLDCIINAQHWLIPLSPQHWRLGATHEHRFEHRHPTAEGRQQLLHWLNQQLPNLNYRVSRHQAGVRPGTPDRYPLLGPHAQHPCVWVFNGFGARGSLTIPYYAECLIEHWLQDQPLPNNAHINRFIKRR